MGEFVGHTDLIHGLGLTSDETLLFTASFDMSLRLWDVTEAVCLKVF